MAFIEIELGAAIAAVIVTILTTSITIRQFQDKKRESRHIEQAFQRIKKYETFKKDTGEMHVEEKPSAKPVTNEDLMEELKRFEESISREEILSEVRQIKNSAKIQLFIGIAGSSVAGAILSFIVTKWIIIS